MCKVTLCHTPEYARASIHVDRVVLHYTHLEERVVHAAVIDAAYPHRVHLPPRKKHMSKET
jgi:hypothetical protein